MARTEIGWIKSIDFRELKEGSLVSLVGGAQPVVFEDLEKTESRVSDYDLKLITLDPVEGLSRKVYSVDENGFITSPNHITCTMSPSSEEGQKYLAMITGGDR